MRGVDPDQLQSAAEIGLHQLPAMRELAPRLVRPRHRVGVHGLEAESLTWRGQLVALADAEVQQLVGGVSLGVAGCLVPLRDAETLGNTQRQDPVALVGGGDVVVTPVLALTAQAQGRDAAASCGKRVVVVLGSHRVVVEQAQAEQAAGGAAQLESVTVVA